MTTVQNILRRKGHGVFSISPDATVSAALEMMQEKDVGALLVMQNGTLAGIFSERDFARKVILNGPATLNASVKDLMTSDVITVTPDQTIDECMALMTDHHIRHLPVIENRRVTGVVSIGDAVAALNSEKEQLIVQLESYITGAR